MIERISSFFTSTIVIAVLAAVLTLLSICVLLRPVAASERPAGDAGTGSSVTATTEHPQRDFQARASAKASAAAVSKSGPRGCRAESATQAEARAGDDHDHQEDHDSKEQSDGGCRAEASSRATATSDDGSE